MNEVQISCITNTGAYKVALLILLKWFFKMYLEHKSLPLFFGINITFTEINVELRPRIKRNVRVTGSALGNCDKRSSLARFYHAYIMVGKY